MRFCFLYLFNRLVPFGSKHSQTFTQSNVASNLHCPVTRDGVGKLFSKIGQMRRLAIHQGVAKRLVKSLPLTRVVISLHLLKKHEQDRCQNQQTSDDCDRLVVGLQKSKAGFKPRNQHVLFSSLVDILLSRFGHNRVFVPF